MSAENTTARIYLYGIIQCEESRPLEIAGVNDAPVRSLAHGSVAAAVSDFSGGGFGDDIAAVARHENVLERLMERCAVLPARFGRVLTAGEVNELLAANHDAFLHDLHRVRGRLEFDLKVMWPASEVRALIQHHDPFVAAAFELEKTNGPGVRYALYKQRECAIERVLRCRAQGYAEGIQRSLLPLCSECRCEVIPAEGVMLEGAYLVERQRAEDFRAVIDTLQSRSGKFCFMLNGPWPPYAFVSLKTAPSVQMAAV